jgi:oxygen-independent coproporphyrinogen-3 oxidase
LSIDELEQLEQGAKSRIPQLIADELIDGVQALKGRLVLTLKGRLLADAVVRGLTN